MRKKEMIERIKGLEVSVDRLKKDLSNAERRILLEERETSRLNREIAILGKKNVECGGCKKILPAKKTQPGSFVHGGCHDFLCPDCISRSNFQKGFQKVA